MKKKGSLVLIAALFAAGMLCMDRLPARAAGEQAGQEPIAETQDESIAAQEETTQSTTPLSGTCGENLTWTFDEGSGTLTISGTGEMEDYDLRGPWTENDHNLIEGDDRVKAVVIEDGVTSIGAYAFAGCSGLKEIALPQSISKIGEYAFDMCKSLKEITVPNGVAAIEKGTFMSCDTLGKINLPESVTSIGDDAFSGCEGLRNIILPNGITDIGDEAFGYCGSLEEIILPSGMTRVGDRVFSECSNLTKAVLPAGVISIGDWAFDECGSLREIILPEKLEYIGQDAFYRCSSLTEVTIPASVSETGDRVFGDCSSLRAVYFMGGLPEFADRWYGIKGPGAPAVGVFYGVTANVYYSDDPSWNADTMKDYGGSLTWLRRLYIIAEENGIEVTDKVYVIGSGTDAAIKCSGAAEDFVSLAIDGEIVAPSYYKVESGSTILTVLSAFLDRLAVGDHKVTLNYTYGSVDTVLTIIDRQENTEKPENPTKPADSTKPAGNSTGAADRQNGDRKSPQTGEPQTENVWPMTLAILGIGGTALLILKRKTAENRS